MDLALSLSRARELSTSLGVNLYSFVLKIACLVILIAD